MNQKQKVDVIILSITLCVLLFSLSLQAQWTKQTNGLDSWFMATAIDACNTQTAVLTSGSEIYLTINAGETWQKITLPDGAGFISDISIIDASLIWFCDGNGKIFATTNGGVDWSQQFANVNQTQFMNYIEMFDMNNGMAMGDAVDLSNTPEGPALIIKTTDGGNTWTSVNDSTIGGSSGDTWRRIDFINPDMGYFFASGANPQKIYKTTNGCTNWETTNYDDYVQHLSFYDENIGLTIPGSGVVKRTTDGGNTWETFVSPHAGWGNDIEFAPGDPSRVWLTDNKKLFFSSDTGRTWTAQISNCKGRDIVFADSWNGWVLCDNAVYFTNSGGTASVEWKTINKLDDFVLHQNYPNPFNNSTTVRFSLKKSSDVELSIYNLSGKKVEKLVSGSLPAGNHSINWNAANFSSGAYFYKLKANHEEQIRKLILLK